MEISIEQRRENVLRENNPELKEIMDRLLYKGRDIRIVGFGSTLEPGDTFLVGLPNGVGIRELTCLENRTLEDCVIIAQEPYLLASYNSWECVKIEYLEPHAWTQPEDKNSYEWHRALCGVCGRGSQRPVHRKEDGSRIPEVALLQLEAAKSLRTAAELMRAELGEDAGEGPLFLVHLAIDIEDGRRTI